MVNLLTFLLAKSETLGRVTPKIAELSLAGTAYPLGHKKSLTRSASVHVHPNSIAHEGQQIGKGVLSHDHAQHKCQAKACGQDNGRIFLIKTEQCHHYLQEKADTAPAGVPARVVEAKLKLGCRMGLLRGCTWQRLHRGASATITPQSPNHGQHPIGKAQT